MTSSSEVDAEGARLERAVSIVGHVFRDRALLLRALTHKSLRNERDGSVHDNEVLELLGDAVLSLVTVEHLVANDPLASEGELTDRRAAYVSEDALAKKADASGLTELLRTGKGIAGNVPLSVRADLVEALLGAVYLDGGLNAARASVTRLLGPPPAASPERADNAKRTLQERLQALFGEAPVYDVTRGEGPNHAPTFKATAMFRGVSLGEGIAGNKRLATEAAAAAALTRIDDEELVRTFGARAAR